MSKGITLFEDEAERLAKALCRRYGLMAASGEKGAGNKGRSGAYERFTDDDMPFDTEDFAAKTTGVAEESLNTDESTLTEEAEEGGTS